MERQSLWIMTLCHVHVCRCFCICMACVLNFECFLSGRLFKKIELNESIRYASGDPIESWLNGLLCLDVANAVPNLSRLYCASFILPFKDDAFFI